MRFATAAILLVLAACGSRDPSRIIVESDTLVINGRLPNTLPVRALDKSGRTIAHPLLDFSGGSNAVHVARDGRVTCAKSGDAPVTISRGAVRAQLFVRCRPIRSFGPFAITQLVVGDPPRPLIVRAFGDGGEPITLLHATAAIRDTNVARFDGGLVRPLARGKTWVAVAVGDDMRQWTIEIDERVIEAPIHLVGGQMMSWRLAPGYYEIRLDSFNSKPLHRALHLSVYRANCAQALDGGEHYYCITRDRSSVIVQNSPTVGSGIELSGKLQVLRKPQ